MTTSSPAAPNRPRTSRRAASTASSCGLRDDHALAGGQAAALTTIGRALRAQARPVEVVACECAVAGGGYAVAGEKFLGEGLGALQPRGRLARAEARQSRGREGIDDAEHQRRLGPDDGQCDVLALGERRERRDVVGGDGDVAHLRLGGGAGIARGHQHLADARGRPRTSRPAHARVRRRRRSVPSSRSPVSAGSGACR